MRVTYEKTIRSYTHEDRVITYDLVLPASKVIELLFYLNSINTPSTFISATASYDLTVRLVQEAEEEEAK